MPYTYNPETGKYDIFISLDDARAEGYGNMSDQEKRELYDKSSILNPYTESSFEIGDPAIKQEYMSMSKTPSATTTDYDYLEAIGVDTEHLRQRGSGRQSNIGQRTPEWNPYADQMFKSQGYDIHGNKSQIIDPQAYARNISNIRKLASERLEAELQKDPELQLKTAGYGGIGDWLADTWLPGARQNIANLGDWWRDLLTGSETLDLKDTRYLFPSDFDALEVAEGIVIPHEGHAGEPLPTGFVPSGYDDFSTNYNPYYSYPRGGGHTVTFSDEIALKQAYINALNAGYHEGMIPAGARIGDGTVSAIIASKTGMDINLVNRLGKALSGAAASAVTMSTTGNFPLAAMAYFGVNTLLGGDRRRTFEGINLGEAAINGIQIPKLEMTLPAGLPNSIFKDYRYICYDRVSLKWYPSDLVQPLNYDGGNDYRWICLDRVTGDIYKCNTIKRPRIFLD